MTTKSHISTFGVTETKGNTVTKFNQSSRRFNFFLQAKFMLKRAKVSSGGSDKNIAVKISHYWVAAISLLYCCCTLIESVEDSGSIASQKYCMHVFGCICVCVCVCARTHRHSSTTLLGVSAVKTRLYFPLSSALLNKRVGNQLSTGWMTECHK